MNSEHAKHPKLTLTIPSKTNRLQEVRTFVSDAARTFGFPEDDVNSIALAVDEACTNIIKHAYRYAANREINVVIRMSPPEFEVLIADRGNHFDPNRVTMPDMREYLTHFKRGGLGMYLMKRLMDKVEYRIQPSKNVVRLIKYLH